MWKIYKMFQFTLSLFVYYLKAHNAVLDNNFGNICITKLTCSIDLQRTLVSKNEVVNCLVGLKVYQQKQNKALHF